MSVSSGPAVGHGAQEDTAPLPLIHYPRCNLGVTGWHISGSTKNPGRHYYKCEFHASGRCGFWKWENEYIDYFIARWGHIFAPAAAPPQNDETRAILLQNQRQLANMMMVLIATLFSLVLLLAAKL